MLDFARAVDALLSRRWRRLPITRQHDADDRVNAFPFRLQLPRRPGTAQRDEMTMVTPPLLMTLDLFCQSLPPSALAANAHFSAGHRNI